MYRALITKGLLLGLLFFVIPNHGNAQVTGLSEIGQDNINVSVQPEFPNSYQEVTVSISSSLTDLGRASMSWFVDGSIRDRGVGNKSIIFTTGALGDTSSIEVVIETEEGATFTKSIRLTPADLDLMWEADTYTPAFYRGKALRSNYSNLRIIAMPHFYKGSQKISARNLNYEWRKNHNSLPENSGRGKNILSTKSGNVFMDDIITVIVSSDDGSLIARKNLTIRASSPKVLLYALDPLSGPLFSDELSSLELNNNEVSVLALPLFFPLNLIKSGALQYAWSVNGSTALVDEDSPHILRLRHEGGDGSSAVNASVSDPSDILLGATGALQVFFGQSNIISN